MIHPLNTRLAGILLTGFLGCLSCTPESGKTDNTVPEAVNTLPVQQDTCHFPALKPDMTALHLSTAEMRCGEIPAEVFQLTQLRSLYIMSGDCDYVRTDDQGNEIRDCWSIYELPASIGNLTELEELSLPVSVISELPPEIGKLKKLRVLFMDDSTLENWDAIVGCENIEEISINGSRIASIPPGIGKLKKLKSLSLISCPISPADQKALRALLPKCEIMF